MRRDWRGPSSSSTMRRVGLLAGPAFCAGGGSEVVSKRERKGVAVKAVGAIGECALRDRARGSQSVLVGKVPIEMIVALADTHAEDVAGRNRDTEDENTLCHGRFALNIRAAGGGDVGKFTWENKVTK